MARWRLFFLGCLMMVASSAVSASGRALQAAATRDNENSASPEYTLLPNAKCLDPLIKTFWNSNPSDCRRRCSASTSCGAWSFTKPAWKCELRTSCNSKEWDDSYQSGVKQTPGPGGDSSSSSLTGEDSGESGGSPGEPWDGCSANDDGWLEKDSTGCINPDDGFYTKASPGDTFGGVKYTGYWQSCKGLCAAAAQGSIPPSELVCGRGHYVTFNKETGACFFYGPPSADGNGCEEWRSKDSDRLGMYCGPEDGGPTSSSEEEADYNRRYSGWKGEYCSGSETIRSVDCEGDDRDCRELCAAECDKEKECQAFLTDYDVRCDLYKECDTVVIDGCDDCTVQICLENCPEGTKPYYVRYDYWQGCDANNRIDAFDTDCGSDCEDSGGVRDDCADKCAETPGCNDFFMPEDYSECQLFTDCDLDYHDDSDGGYVGSFRQERDPVDSSAEDSSDSDEVGEPWEDCADFDEEGWIEKESVGCINSKDGFYHKAAKGDIYNTADSGEPVEYDGTFQGCKSLCVASLVGDLDDSIGCYREHYVTYSESSSSCYFYTSPGGDNGCDEWRPKTTDRVAMYCGMT